MKIGIIGLPLVGKTTFFNLLTKSHAETSSFVGGRVTLNIGTAKIPDRRIDFLSKLYNPKKITHATIDFTDVPGLSRGASSTGGTQGQFLSEIRKVDALVHVVRLFSDKDIPHIDGDIDPMRDIENVNLELLFADLNIIETRIERIENSKKITKDNLSELEVLKKCRTTLEQGKLLTQLILTDEEKNFLKSFEFLSEKPVILVINISEDSLIDKSYKDAEKVKAFAYENSIPIVECCAKTEMELYDLAEDDKIVFMKELGIDSTGIDAIASTSYDMLGLISFLTVGEDEVRAWTIAKGLEAKKAAGKVHSDIERGFIRAEVVKYNDIEALGTMSKAKEKGLYRLEGKEYIVEDGDIINFRFNI